MPTPALAQFDPKQAARQFVEEQSDATRLVSFAAELDRRLVMDQLTRVMTLASTHQRSLESGDRLGRCEIYRHGGSYWGGC